MIKHPVEVDGVLYSSKISACRALKVPISTFKYRLSKGCSIRQALGLDKIVADRAVWFNSGFRDTQGEVDCECYNLYEVVNLLDGKTYVGLTVQSIKRRFEGHLCCAKKGVSHPLYNAMRKYGFHNFEIRLIRDDATSGLELQQQEIAEIAHRRHQGIIYNIYPGGQSGNAKTIQIGLQSFNSRAEAARYYGIDTAVFSLRISRLKWTPEQAAEIEPPPNVKRHRVKLNDTILSLKAAAEQLGVNYKNAHLRVTNGWTFEQALGLEPPPDEKRLHIAVEIDGVRYSTLKEAADAVGLKPGTVHNRLRYQNLTVRQALGLDPFDKRPGGPRKPIEAYGQTYVSITACALTHGVDMKALSYRMINLGETPEQALEQLSRSF